MSSVLPYKALKGEGDRGIWARESAWRAVSRPNSLPLPNRTPATQASLTRVFFTKNCNRQYKVYEKIAKISLKMVYKRVKGWTSG